MKKLIWILLIVLTQYKSVAQCNYPQLITPQHNVTFNMGLGWECSVPCVSCENAWMATLPSQQGTFIIQVNDSSLLHMYVTYQCQFVSADICVFHLGPYPADLINLSGDFTNGEWRLILCGNLTSTITVFWIPNPSPIQLWQEVLYQVDTLCGVLSYPSFNPPILDDRDSLSNNYQYYKLNGLDLIKTTTLEPNSFYRKVR